MTAALDGRSPTILTRIGAERLTARIRAQLTSTLELLATAREGRAWEAMGYPDWHSYCEGEYGDLRELRLPRTERLALVASMRTASSPLSTRAIRERLGVSASSVQDDLAQLRAAGELAGERVVGRDGVERPARRLQAVAEPEVAYPSATARALALVAAQGDRGLTVRELCLETGWHHGSSSGALSRLARRGQVVAGPGARLGCMVYRSV